MKIFQEIQGHHDTLGKVMMLLTLSLQQKGKRLLYQLDYYLWQAKQPMIGLYLGETIVGVACLNNPEEGVTSERFWHWRLKMLLAPDTSVRNK